MVCHQEPSLPELRHSFSKLLGILELFAHSVMQSCLTLCGPMVYSPARLLCPWNFPGKYTGVACLFYTRGSSQPRDWTQVSCISCIGRWILYHWATWEVRWEYQTTLPASWEICMQVKKEQLEPDMNNRLVPNWERSMSRLYIVTPLI